MKTLVADELASDKENIKKGEEASKKPLIEILETCQDKPNDLKTKEETEPVDLKTIEVTNKQAETILQKSENNDYQQPEGIIREGNIIIDHDKKLLRNLPKENNRDNISQLNNKSNENKTTENFGKPMRKINILEIKATESKSINTKQVSIKEISRTISEDNKDKKKIGKNIMVTEIPKAKDNSEKKVKDEKEKDKDKKTKKEEKDSLRGNDAASASGSQGSGDSQQCTES